MFFLELAYKKDMYYLNYKNYTIINFKINISNLFLISFSRIPKILKISQNSFTINTTYTLSFKIKEGRGRLKPHCFWCPKFRTKKLEKKRTFKKSIFQDPLSGKLETEFETPTIPEYQVGGNPSEDPQVDFNWFFSGLGTAFFPVQNVPVFPTL